MKLYLICSLLLAGISCAPPLQTSTTSSTTSTTTATTTSTTISSTTTTEPTATTGATLEEASTTVKSLEVEDFITGVTDPADIVVEVTTTADVSSTTQEIITTTTTATTTLPPPRPRLSGKEREALIAHLGNIDLKNTDTLVLTPRQRLAISEELEYQQLGLPAFTDPTPWQRLSREQQEEFNRKYLALRPELQEFSK